MTILRRNDQQVEVRYPGVNRRVLTGSNTGSKMLSVGDIVIQPGSKIPYHMHPNVEESMYVAEGELIMKLDGRSFDISSGDCVLALKGISHGLENVSHNPARLITVFPDVSPEVEQVNFSSQRCSRSFFSPRAKKSFAAIISLHLFSRDVIDSPGKAEKTSISCFACS